MRIGPGDVLPLILFVVLLSTYSLAADDLSVSGRLTLDALYPLDHGSVREDPSLTARLIADYRRSQWHLRSWIEGGWDGTVHSPTRDHSVLKDFDRVYQDNTPYVDVKEFYVERSFNSIDCRVGIQCFSWGRLDEYPVNDLFNPWDYTRFIVRPLEERKIGVPSISTSMAKADWSYQVVWVPWLVPYRLPKPNERWSLIPAGSILSNVTGAEVIPEEPVLPARKVSNGSAGIRIQHFGEIEWAVNLFHGYDPRPVFKSTALHVTESGGTIVIEPGFVPSFHKITSIGMDAAAVKGDWSLRAEAAYALGRVFDVRQDLWGYPQTLVLGTTLLNPVEIRRNTLDYGAAADYRIFEDWLLTLQAQQTVIFDRPDTLYEKEIETILWANLRVFWMNQKIETNLNVAYNPEHGASMVRLGAYYVFTDSLKTGLTALFLDGPPQSTFGRYSMNDQIAVQMVYSW